MYKTTMKKIYKVTIMVYAIIFIIGYLGGFKYMNIVLNHYIEYSDYIMYALIFFLSIGIFYPFLREGFKTFDKEVLNEISTVFLIIAFLSVLIQVLLGEGEEKESSPFLCVNSFQLKCNYYLCSFPFEFFLNG